MSIPLTINGAVFEYPVDFDENWGVDATGWAQAVTNGMLQMAGGSFPLTADINFGPNFGLLSKYFETRSSLPATTGTVRLSSADAGIAWRNFANSGNNILTTDASNNLQYNGATISGGVNSGTQYQLGYYATTGSNISGLTLITASRALASDANGLPVASSTTAVELGFVNGVTSAIQTQINAKAPSANPTFTGIVGIPISAGKALISDGSSQLAASATTSTELGFVNGVTSSIQTQINTKAPSASPTFTGTVTVPNGTAATNAAAFGQIKVIQIVTATSTSSTTTASTSFVDTNLSCTITPTSASNKVFIIASGVLTANGTLGQISYVTLANGSTNLLNTNGGGFVIATNNTSNTSAPCTLTFLDSPATTSAITYRVRLKSSAANAIFGDGTTTQSMTLVEVVA